MRFVTSTMMALAVSGVLNAQAAPGLFHDDPHVTGAPAPAKDRPASSSVPHRGTARENMTFRPETDEVRGGRGEPIGKFDYPVALSRLDVAAQKMDGSWRFTAATLPGLSSSRYWLWLQLDQPGFMPDAMHVTFTAGDRMATAFYPPQRAWLEVSGSLTAKVSFKPSWSFRKTIELQVSPPPPILREGRLVVKPATDPAGEGYRCDVEVQGRGADLPLEVVAQLDLDDADLTRLNPHLVRYPPIHFGSDVRKFRVDAEGALSGRRLRFVVYWKDRQISVLEARMP